VADEAPERLGLGGPWPPLQEILRCDDVVRTSCPGPNDVLFRRCDDVEPWTPDDVFGTSDDDVCWLRLYDVWATTWDDEFCSLQGSPPTLLLASYAFHSRPDTFLQSYWFSCCICFMYKNY